MTLNEKAESFNKLADEAESIVGRMESSMSRLTSTELETLGPGRKKEMAQLKETMYKLKHKATEALMKRRNKSSDESTMDSAP